MKRTFYIFLMIVFFILISFFVYFSCLIVLVRHGIIPISYIDWFLGMMMSRIFYIGVGLLGCALGYFFGQRWWQIIYVDGVYYFDKSKKRATRIPTIRKAPKEEIEL